MKTANAIKRLLTLSVASSFIGAYTLPIASAADLNLSSSTASMPAGSHSAPVAINVGGSSRVVQPGANLTPAEYMAVQQVMQTGAQQLGLDAAGRAVSGRVVLDGIVPSNLSSLVIPQGVTAINNFANTAGLMNIAGNLVNSGSLYAVSTDRALATAAINAANIVNNKGALLTSVLPANGLLGYANAIKNLSLSLNASQAVSNAGTISSAADLNVTAGGAITNSGTMQAANSVNIGSTAGGAVDFHGAGGTVKAGNAINVGDMVNTSTVTLVGGAWLSPQLNIASSGMVNARLGETTGVVNLHANGAHFSADTSDLKLGNICVNGDPYFLSTGNLSITSAMNITTNGYPFLAVAGGNINTTDSGYLDINTSSSLSFGGGDVTLIAGADYTEDPNPQDFSQPGVSGYYHAVTVNGTSLTGGSIRLDDRTGTGGGAGVRNIDTRGLGAIQPDSGNVTLIAYGGFDPNSGNIIMRQDGKIDTSALGGARPGDVLVIAGSHDTNAVPAVQLPDIYANGGTGGGGSISIMSADPSIAGGTTAVFDGDGQSVSGWFVPAGFSRIAGAGQDNFAPLNGNMNLMSLNGSGQNAPDVVTNGFIVLDGSTNGTAITWSATPSQISNGSALNALRDNVTNLIGSQILVNGSIYVPDSHLVVKTNAAGVTLNGPLVGAGAIDITAANAGTVSGAAFLVGGTVVNNTSGAYIDDLANPGTSKNTGAVNITAGDAITINSVGSLDGDVNLTAASIGTQGTPVRVVAQGTEGSVFLGGHAARVTTRTSGSTYLTSDFDTNFNLPYSKVGNTSTFSLTTTAGADINLVGDLFFAYASPGTAVPLGGEEIHLISSGDITFQEINYLFANNVELSATNGSITAIDTSLPGSIGPALAVNASNLVIASKGNVEVTGADNITTAPSAILSLRTTLGPNAVFNFQTDATYNGSPIGIDLGATNLGAGAKLDVTSGNGLRVQQVVSAGDNAELMLKTTGGAITVSDNINMASGGKVTFNSASGISIENASPIQFGAGGTIDFTAAGTINTSGGSSLAAQNVRLDAPGFDIGGPTGPLVTKTSDLQIFNAKNVVAVNQLYDFNFGANNVGSLALLAEKSVTISGGINSRNAFITSLSGNVTVDSHINGDGSAAELGYVQIDALSPGGQVSINTGKSVTAKDSVSINTSTFHGNGTLNSKIININGAPGTSLTVDGTGAYNADTVNFVAPPDTVTDSSSITFGSGSQINVDGNMNVIANGHSQAVATFSGSSVNTTGLLTVYGNQMNLGGGSIDSRGTKLVMPNGKGVVASLTGDLKLTSNFTAVGQSVTFIAPGNITAGSNVTSINVSNPKGQGGSVTLIAGYDVTRDHIPLASEKSTISGLTSDVNTLYTIGFPSASGGNILLPSVSFNTSSGLAASDSGIAGDFLAVAHGAPGGAAGVISINDVNASANNTLGKGGNVTLIGQGGVAVDSINTNGGFAGKVTIMGAVPDIVGGAMTFQDGYNRTGATFVASPIQGRGEAAITVGSITANSTGGHGGAVTLKSDSNIQVLRDIQSRGLNAFESSTAGGQIDLSSTGGYLAVGGSIDASGIDYTNTKVVHDGGSGGSITLTAPQYIEIGKNLIANGGKSVTNPGNGGNAGTIFAVTTTHDPNFNYNVGEILIHGFVKANGGTGERGGDGGIVGMSAGQIRVLGKDGSFSVRAQAGASDNVGLGFPAFGQVFLNTFASQPLPTNINLHITKTDIAKNPALAETSFPGGVFSVGVANPVNGTAGGIVTGSELQAVKSATVKETVPNDFDLQQQGVNINVTGGDLGTFLTMTHKDANGAYSLTGESIMPGKKITPATALSLYSEWFGPNDFGHFYVDDVTGAGTDRGLNSLPDSGFVKINAADIRVPFTNFDTTTPDGQVSIGVYGERALLDLSQAKTVKIDGVIDFRGASSAAIDFGKTTTPLTTKGGLTNVADLTLMSDATSFTNLGRIEPINTLYLLPTAATFALSNKVGAKISVSAGAGNGVLLSANGAAASLKITNEGDFTTDGVHPVPFLFANKQTGLINGVAALRTLPFTVARKIDLTLQLGKDADISGQLRADSISIKTINGGTTTSILNTGLIVHNADIRTTNNGGIKLVSGDILTLKDSNLRAFDTSAGATKPSAATTFSLTAVGDIKQDHTNIFVYSGGKINGDTYKLTNKTGNDILSTQSALSITAKHDITIGGRISSCANMTVTSTSGRVDIDSNGFLDNSTKLLTIQAATGAQISGRVKSGEVFAVPDVTTGTFGPTVSSQQGSIKIVSTGQFSTIEFMPGASIESSGSKGLAGNVDITSTGDLTGHNHFSITADGGNVTLTAKRLIGFDKNPGYLPNTGVPTIIARALGTATASVGGNVMITAGIGSQALVVPKTPVAVDPTSLSVLHPSNIDPIDNLVNGQPTGALIVHDKDGKIELASFGTANTNLKLRGGVITLNSYINPKAPLDLNGVMRMDGVSIQTYGFKPISHAMTPSVDFVVDTNDE